MHYSFPFFRFCLLAIFVFLLGFSSLAQAPIHSSEATHHPIVAKNGMVASQHELATQVGIEILEKGGNAIDAAVGVGFALAVVLPRAGNLGGGGFMLLHHTQQNKTTAINYREMGPSAAHKDMFLDANGDVDKTSFNQSYKSIGVPGTVAGMIHALENYGTMSLSEVIAPAIRLAEKGFAVTHDLARVLRDYEKRLRKCPESARIFFKETGFYEAGDILKQPDLAWSLKQVSKKGWEGFYAGELAKRLAEGIQENGGIMTTEDFRNYKVSETDAVKGTYRGYEIISMPPPSSGGIHVIQMLNLLEAFPLGYLGHNSAETIHLMAESMRLAYADRSKHLGDPAFWEVPVAGLASKSYADHLRAKINRYQANDSEDILPGTPQDFESEETTHFSVVDKYGNVVSNTYTLNFSFGTGLVIPGTGILLNNEMGDFAAKPGEADAYGLIGGTANAVQAGKRPLSSMTPTLVFKDGKPFLATGSPGGSRIITTVLQFILNVIDHDMNVAEATHAPRMYTTSGIQIYCTHEKGISYDTKVLLVGKGHTLKRRTAMGSTQSIMVKEGLFYGASDPRRPDARTKGIRGE